MQVHLRGSMATIGWEMNFRQPEGAPFASVPHLFSVCELGGGAQAGRTLKSLLALKLDFRRKVGAGVLRWERWNPRTGGPWGGCPELYHQGCRHLASPASGSLSTFQTFQGSGSSVASRCGDETSSCLCSSLSH